MFRSLHSAHTIFNASKLITSIPLSYGGSSILKVNVSFNYDRYIINPKTTNNGNKETSSLTFDRVDPEAKSKVPGTKVETPKAPTPQKEPKGAAQRAATPTEQLRNTGNGRDGTFGDGTFGAGRPSG